MAPWRSAYRVSRLAVNPKGALYDCVNDDVRWQSGAAVGTDVTKDAWTIEMRFPLAAMAPAKEGDSWTFNVTRQVPHYEHPKQRD